MDNELTFGEIDPRDLDQESELLKLLGKQAHRGLLLRKAERESNHLLFGDEVPDLAEPMGWTQSPIPDLEQLQEIVDWAINQGEEIAQRVFTFLDDPDPASLKALLAHLKEQGVLTEEKTPSENTPNSLAALVLRSAGSQKGDKVGVTKEELYQLARDMHIARRPEAAIRQLLRRLLKEGKLKEVTDQHGQLHYTAT